MLPGYRLTYILSILLLPLLPGLRLKPDFVLGQFSVASADVTLQVLKNCSGIHEHLDNTLMAFSAVKGLSLSDNAELALNCEYNKALSEEMNRCASRKSLNESEILYHAALSLWPWNVLVLKNLAHMLEVNGFFIEPASLYMQVMHMKITF